MAKILSANTTSVIFLTIILFVGTISITSPSYIMEVDAQIDQKYDNNNYYDNRNYQEPKKTDMNILKIKCSNINFNLNGIKPNNQPVSGDSQTPITQAQETNQDQKETNNNNEIVKESNDKIFTDKNWIDICTNLNENSQIITPDGITSQPILTVTKEMFICNNPDIQLAAIGGGFQIFRIDCQDSSEMIPDPDSQVWIPWDDCIENNFCPFFDEEDFLMQIEQNPGPNFIRYEFPGTSEGRSVNVESGTYQVGEEVTPNIQCSNTADYENGAVFIVDGSQFSTNPNATFCFTLEGDCSGTIQPGEEKACTVKNYLDRGSFAIPIT